MGDKPNYHGFLFNIAPSMDKVLQKFKEQEARHNVSPPWLGQSINLLFKEMRTFYKPIVKIKEVEFTNLTTIPVIGGFLGGIFSFIQGLEWYWITLIIVGAIAILLAIMIPFILGRMLDLHHPYFYLPAYKTFRKNEFNLLNHTVHDKHVSYGGLAHFVNGLITKKEDELAVVKAITEQYNQEKESLRQQREWDK